MNNEPAHGTSGPVNRFFGSLRFRVLAMLSLALLPIGLIAVIQTKQVADGQRENSELVLFTRTETASFEERIVIEQARGAARLLGTLQSELASGAECEEYLRAFVSANARFSFIGVLPKSGKMECSSAGESFDFSGFEGFDEQMGAEEATVMVNQDAPLSGTSVIVISEPFYELGVFQGLISVSVPHKALLGQDEGQEVPGLANVITFNAQGDILTSSGDLDRAELDTPASAPLSELATRGAFSFSGRDRSGHERIFSVVPIIDDTVFTLGVWDTNSEVAQRVLGQMPPWIFPALMWSVSLIVALFAVHRLVIRHVKRLSETMKGFAKDRALPKSQLATAPSVELADMENDFFAMAETILREEARLEDTLRDKNVLIKEVHHRVKNNLQLISSIMNMQRRRAASPETKQVLARLQDRVLSLATIHRDLYQSQSGGRVDAGRLVHEIVEKSVEIGEEANADVIRKVEVDPILLYPDQAVPLSLLIAEASTNAMKYLGPDAKGEQWVDVSLKVSESQFCTVTFSNSTTGDALSESTGLGAQLINAFTMQLGGQVETEKLADRYCMTLTFQIEEFIEETGDY